ncbi:MAG: orotidine-5'-phosphate decarboxylase [Gammaproteobacteria bacterium]|nr:orotidine-5'-phosphate decarboxylase [Gammaproteobacteria bacterium]MDH3466648.1 orotidine-5'-phosphate decarboxylase [Gammaproteobacteria bacterium]
MNDARNQIPPAERLIMALDVPGIDDAKSLVADIGDAVSFYKLGLELCMSGGYFELVDWLSRHNKKVFVDLKFFDIPHTVGKAVQQLNRYKVRFATVHGNDSIMRAAAEAKGDIGILAVTALTSLDKGDLDDLGFQCDVQELVLSRARRAMQHGCDGVVASGLEVEQLRLILGDRLIIVTPGIRPIHNAEDQKRVVTPRQALSRGADYIVVGRPIYGAADPRHAALKILEEINCGLDAGQAQYFPKMDLA